MQIDKREKRQYLGNALLNTIPDIVLAAVIAWIFSGGVVGFFVTFAALQLIYLVIWLKNTAWQWLMFQWRGRKSLAAYIEQLLTGARFPQPRQRYGAAEDYLTQVMADDDAPVDARMVSAVLNSWHGYAISSGRYQEALRLSLALEDALVAYKPATGTTT